MIQLLACVFVINIVALVPAKRIKILRPNVGKCDRIGHSLQHVFGGHSLLSAQIFDLFLENPAEGLQLFHSITNYTLNVWFLQQNCSFNFTLVRVNTFRIHQGIQHFAPKFHAPLSIVPAQTLCRVVLIKITFKLQRCNQPYGSLNRYFFPRTRNAL